MPVFHTPLCNMQMHHLDIAWQSKQLDMNDLVNFIAAILQHASDLPIASPTALSV